MALFNPFSDAFGLDIGDRTFKLVQVRRARGKRNYRIRAWNSVEVPEGVMDKGDIKDMDAAVAHVEKLLKTVRGGRVGGAVVACLPEVKTFIKIVEAPPDAHEVELRKEVTSEIERNIPLPMEEIYYDWQLLQESPMPPGNHAESPADAASAKDAPPEAAQDAKPPEDAPPRPQRLLVGAAPKNLSDDYCMLLERAGLLPIAMEIEATAITRAVVPQEGFGDDAIGILDIGGNRSSLVIYDSGALQMSISIPISGIAITKLIAEALSVSQEDAELLKRECGLDASRCEDKMWKILLPLIDDMSEKVRNALRFYKIGFPRGKKIERLYLCGGGAQFREIDNVLSRKLTIQVKPGDALVNIDPKVGIPKAFPRGAEALSYATALGLAMRAADEISTPPRERR